MKVLISSVGFYAGHSKNSLIDHIWLVLSFITGSKCEYLASKGALQSFSESNSCIEKYWKTLSFIFLAR